MRKRAKQLTTSLDRSRSWDSTWLDIASVMSARARCTRAGVGAVVVGVDNRIVSTGYNGPPAGLDVEGDCSNFCPRSITSQPSPDYADCVTVHAELNAIAYADRSRMQDGTIYITATPCWSCAKVIANSGIKRVVFINDRDRGTQDTVEFLHSCGLSTRIIDKKGTE